MEMLSPLRGKKISPHYLHRNHSFLEYSKVLSISLKQQRCHSATFTPCSWALSRSLLGQNTSHTKPSQAHSPPLILLAAKILHLFPRFILFFPEMTLNTLYSPNISFKSRHSKKELFFLKLLRKHEVTTTY